MNRLEVYIYIDGRKFDPVKFNASLPRVLSGETRSIFRMNNGVKEVIGKYWRSKSPRVAESGVEAKLFSVVQRYAPHLLRAKVMERTGFS